MREDKRWLMLALYNEKLRFNNKMSHDLWSKIHKPYYLDKEPKALSGIRSLYVEVFSKQSYRGVYLFTEDLDRKQLKFKKTEDDGTVRGELYKADAFGNTTFKELPGLPAKNSEIWGGWELKHPDPEDNDWKNLYNFTQFIIQGNKTDFNASIKQKLHLDNLKDYIIFLNLTQALDNKGKNSFFAKYDTNEPYFYSPWDLDGTLGYYAYGERSYDPHGFLSYHLFDRLIENNPDNFKNGLAARWFELRKNVLSYDSLTYTIDNIHGYLNSNKVYEREHNKWHNVSSSASEVNYMKKWIQDRLEYLDIYFGNWVTDCSAPSLTLADYRITNGESTEITASGCQGIVNWYNSETSTEVLGTGHIYNTPKLYQNLTYFASCTIHQCVSSTRTSIQVEINCSDQKLEFDASIQTPSSYLTREAITSLAKIEGLTNYQSNRSIELLPGFEVEQKNFNAEIKNCE